jgi:hypothetical protein
MPHQTQKNPKIKTFTIHLNSMSWKKKIQEWWPLKIRFKVQQQRSLIMNVQECTWNFLGWTNWLKNTSNIKNNIRSFYIINKFGVICQEWKKKDAWWPPRIRVKMQQKKLLIIIVQEYTRIISYHE